MDEKKVRLEVTDFLGKYDKFVAELKIMTDLRNKYDAPNADFEMKRWRFKKTVEFDLDRAWEKLTAKERSEVWENLMSKDLESLNAIKKD